MSEISDWFKSIPYFTRHWLAFTVALSLSSKFNLISYSYLVLDFDKVIYGYQIWRPVTALFYYPITPGTGLHFLISCYFIYNYSSRLETGQYVGRPADYLFLLIFTWFCCVIVGLIVNFPMLMNCMVMCIVYIWCQLNKDVIVTFWFGSRFKAMYFPFVLLAFNMIIAGGGMDELVGILVGHVYFFLKYKYPQELGGQQFISTPAILYEWFPNERVAGGFGSAPPRRGTPGGGDQGAGGGPRGHNWGRGFVLGD